MSADPAMVDTNVLVYAILQDSDQFQASQDLLDRAQDGEIPLCLTPQVLAELYSVITNPSRVSHPCPSDQAVDVVEEFLAMPGLTLLPMPPDVVSRWADLARRHPVRGGAIYDLQLAATMLGNGIHRIYTYNRADFEAIEGLEVLAP